jgi:hypothetical protein
MTWSILIGPYYFQRQGPGDWSIFKMSPHFGTGNSELIGTGFCYQTAKAWCRKANRGRL